MKSFTRIVAAMLFTILTAFPRNQLLLSFMNACLLSSQAHPNNLNPTWLFKFCHLRLCYRITKVPNSTESLLYPYSPNAGGSHLRSRSNCMNPRLCYPQRITAIQLHPCRPQQLRHHLLLVKQDHPQLPLLLQPICPTLRCPRRQDFLHPLHSHRRCPFLPLVPRRVLALRITKARR